MSFGWRDWALTLPTASRNLVTCQRVIRWDSLGQSVRLLRYSSTQSPKRRSLGSPSFRSIWCHRSTISAGGLFLVAPWGSFPSGCCLPSGVWMYQNEFDFLNQGARIVPTFYTVSLHPIICPARGLRRSF